MTPRPPAAGGRMEVAVVGLGLIGGSVARRLAELPARCSVRGWDADPAARAGAAEAGIAVGDSAADAAGGADVVVVALPPEATGAGVVRALRAAPQAAVTDVASAKVRILEQVRAAAPEALDRFVPAHPLAGSESSGWAASRADLLRGAVWAVCPPHAGAPAGPLCRCADLLDAFDARLVVCDPAEHDLAVARTSHAPHLVAELLAASLARGQGRLAAVLSGGGFRDMTRIARADPALWAEILELNREGVLAALDDLAAGLGLMRGALAQPGGGAAGGGRPDGRAVLELVDRLRWSPPSWEPRRLPWPAWDELMALGRQGRAVRRLRPAGDGVRAEVAAADAPGEPGPGL